MSEPPRRLSNGAARSSLRSDLNPANGKSIVENTSSSGHIDYETNEILVTGRSAISAQIYTGRFEVNSGTFTGHLSDEICQALA